MNVFPASNLPVQTQTWGREVEKRINNLDTAFRAAEVNNVTRDSQLISNYRRLDAAFTQLQATTVAANEAQDNSIEALNKSVEALNGLGSLDEATSTYKINANNVTLGTLNAGLVNVTNINASNITTGSLSADRISGGVIDASDISGVNISGVNITGSTITGGSLNTAASGTRVRASGTNIEFYSSAYAGGGSRVGYIQGDDLGSPGLYMISDQGSIGIDAVSITLSGDTTVTGEMDVNGSLTVGGAFSPGSINTGAIDATSLDVTGGIGSGSLSTGNISGTSMTINGGTANLQSGATVNGGLTVGSGNSSLNGGMSTTSITASGDLNLTGRILGSTGTFNATTTSAANLFVASNGNFARSTSSRRYKSDIQSIDYGMAALNLEPRTWVDKAEYEANNNSPDGLERIPGFIAEELHELGLTELVQYNEDGQPDAVYYDRMLVAVIPVIKQQQATIEALEARLAALESKVE